MKQPVQTVMVEIACDTIDPSRLAELLTRGGYDVEKVECERGGEWIQETSAKHKKTT